MQHKYVVTFHSVYWAMEAERELTAAGFSCRLRPVPRQFSSSCGICAEVVAENSQSVLDALASCHLEHEEIYGPL
ncbi:MAG: DUF3343 domain-containing protein [Bacillota bacterium]|jgi:hypothetical protein